MAKDAKQAGRVLVATVLSTPREIDVNFCEDPEPQPGALKDALSEATFYWYCDRASMEFLAAYAVRPSLTEKTRVTPATP
jgi:hypothetical protein